MFSGLQISFINNLDNLIEGFIWTYQPIGCDFLHQRLIYQISNTIWVKFIGIIEFLKNISRSVEIIFFKKRRGCEWMSRGVARWKPKLKNQIRIERMQLKWHLPLHCTFCNERQQSMNPDENMSATGSQK